MLGGNGSSFGCVRLVVGMCVCVCDCGFFFLNSREKRPPKEQSRLTPLSPRDDRCRSLGRRSDTRETASRLLQASAATTATLHEEEEDDGSDHHQSRYGSAYGVGLGGERYSAAYASVFVLFLFVCMFYSVFVVFCCCLLAFILEYAVPQRRDCGGF